MIILDVFRQGIEEIGQKEEQLYREVIEAANYVSEHSMMHYGRRYQTTELLLNNYQAEQRLENTIESIEDVKQQLEGKVKELELKALEIGSEPRYVEKAREKAEDTVDELEDEIDRIKEAKKSPPEQKADQEYFNSRETRAQTVADRLDYTPKRKEGS